jgi:hypothetical protein
VQRLNLHVIAMLDVGDAVVDATLAPLTLALNIEHRSLDLGDAL